MNVEVTEKRRGGESESERERERREDESKATEVGAETSGKRKRRGFIRGVFFWAAGKRACPAPGTLLPALYVDPLGPIAFMAHFINAG